jgi:hypothetical protein
MYVNERACNQAYTPATALLKASPPSGITNLQTGSDSVDIFHHRTEALREEMDITKSQLKILQDRFNKSHNISMPAVLGGGMAGALFMFVPVVGLSIAGAGIVVGAAALITSEITYKSIEKQAKLYKELETRYHQMQETDELARNVSNPAGSEDSVEIGEEYVVIDGLKLEKNPRLLHFLRTGKR